MYIFKCCKAEVKSISSYAREYNKEGNEERLLTCPECGEKSIVYHIFDFGLEKLDFDTGDENCPKC